MTREDREHLFEMLGAWGTDVAGLYALDHDQLEIAAAMIAALLNFAAHIAARECGMNAAQFTLVCATARDKQWRA